MSIIAKIILTALLIMLATAMVGLIGSMTEKEKLCRIALIAFFIEVFLMIIIIGVFIWI